MTQNLMAATSRLPQVLVSQQLAAAETTQYTGGASTSTKLSTATATNTSGSAVTVVAVSLVKSGGTAGAANRIATFTVAAGDSTVLSELAGHFLGPGDFIPTLAGTAAAVSLVVSGVVFS